MANIGSAQLNGAGSVGSPAEVSTIGSRPSSIRHSLDGMKFFHDSQSGTSGTIDTTPSSVVSQASNHISATPPKLQQSFSANDVPTVKTPATSSNLGANANNHAQQHFHNHNASLGRIPAGAMPNRHSRELSNDASLANGREANGFASINSALQANAAPFGPVSTLGHAVPVLQWSQLQRSSRKWCRIQQLASAHAKPVCWQQQPLAHVLAAELHWL
jgi:hypothetical protein